MRRTQLVAARRKTGKSQEKVAQEVGVDRTTVGTWERGEYTPYPHQRPSYANAIGLTLEELDMMLSDLPASPGGTPVWLAQYLGSEQSATEIRTHEPHVVYGLLQTPDYAAEIAKSVGVADETPDSYIERNVEQRRYRQLRVLSGDVQLHVIQPEIALRLRMGSNALMAAQLSRVVELCERPNVAVQIVPFSVGQYEALRMGGITIMVHPWVQGTSVYLKRYEGATLIENVDEASNFVAAFEHASRLALSHNDSLQLIAQVAREWERNSE